MNHAINSLTIYFVLLSILTVSCNNQTVKVEIINNSPDVISDISMKASGAIIADDIQMSNNSSALHTLDLSDIPANDGNYIIIFKRNGIIESDTFGYYTNGAPINDKYIISILDSGINIKER